MKHNVKILQSIATSLLEQGTGYPLKLIYLPLPWCGRVYKLFECILKEKQYDPEEGPLIPENRLFGQFHAPQTGKMKETILNNFVAQIVNAELFLPLWLWEWALTLHL